MNESKKSSAPKSLINVQPFQRRECVKGALREAAEVFVATQARGRESWAAAASRPGPHAGLLTEPRRQRLTPHKP